MNFNVCFTTNNGELPLVEKLGKPGLDILDLIRETYPEIKNLPSSDISFNDHCPINGSIMYIKVDEGVARKSGHFKGKTDVAVVVPEASFSKFVDLEIEKHYSDNYEDTYVFPSLANIPFLQWAAFKTIKVTPDVLYRADVNYTYSSKTIIKQWIADGCPLDWKP